jgi:glutamine synthetase
LSFSVSNKERVYEILEFGERIDGSSLFSSIEPEKSDIYIMPRVERSFVNPFALLPTLNILCDYLDEAGKPLDVAPRNVLTKAAEKLCSSTGIDLRALAELEFYIIAKQEAEALFPEGSDKNYHESAPFARFEDLRNEILAMLAVVGIPTKYAHGEVGLIRAKDDLLMEQHEIEFVPQHLPKMADTIAIAKWVVRNVCMRRGVSVSFVPKIDLTHAGTGMHIHLCGLKNGENIVAKDDGTLSDEALEMIGGILKFAPSLSAFGNPTPISYLRFVARKESPMQICWSTRNRLALMRVPLWWSFRKRARTSGDCRETFEYRASDAFADTYLLLAGLAVAVNYGLEHTEEALATSRNLHVEAADRRRKRLRTLPVSCSESADNLEVNRKYYESDGVFPKELIDNTVARLKAYKDGDMWKEMSRKPQMFGKMLREYLHYG